MCRTWRAASGSTTASAAKFLHAGPGYGGSCFPKDTLALIKTAQDYDAPFVSSRRWSRSTTAQASNGPQGDRGVRRQRRRGKTIAILGLTFKPNTDDMRDAPSLSIIAALQDAGAGCAPMTPRAWTQARRVLHDVDFAESAYGCARRGCAGHRDGMGCVSRARLSRGCRLRWRPVLVDLRNIYRRGTWRRRASPTPAWVGSALPRPAKRRDSWRPSRVRPSAASARTARRRRRGPG